MTGQSEESAVFVGRVRAKAEQIFGAGASGNSVATTYGVHFKYADEQKNRKMTKMLIRIVEIEQDLLKMKNAQ